MTDGGIASGAGRTVRGAGAGSSPNRNTEVRSPNVRRRHAEMFGSGTPGNGLPVGAGFRVPAVVISPWTAGGWVSSEPFDHTSALRFLERVTGVPEPNISAWRRRTFGDLTSVFRFGDAPAPAPRPVRPTR